MATTYTTYENWERLEMAGPYHIYSPGEFAALIPEWKGTTNDAYFVEGQHSVQTWGQAGTNDDFLEIDAVLPTTIPQIYTSFVNPNGELLDSISVSVSTAARPDLNQIRALTLFEQIDDGDWVAVGRYDINPSGSQYPVFETHLFNLIAAQHPFSSVQLGFGCVGCGDAVGAGYLLGDVTFSYHTSAAPGSNPNAPVPEPASLLLLGVAGGIGAIRRRRVGRLASVSLS